MASGRRKLTFLEHGPWEMGPWFEQSFGSFLTSTEMWFVLPSHLATAFVSTRCGSFHLDFWDLVLTSVSLSLILDLIYWKFVSLFLRTTGLVWSTSFSVHVTLWGNRKFWISYVPPKTWGISDTWLGSCSLPNSSMLQFIVYFRLPQPVSYQYRASGEIVFSQTSK